MSTEHPSQWTVPVNRAAGYSLTLGVLSVVAGLTSLPGLIFGVLGLRRAKHLGGAGKGTAVAGIVMSFVGIGMLVLCLRSVLWVSATALRREVAGNFSQLGIAIHSYHDANDQLPSPYTRKLESAFVPVTESELASKLSWRISIWPYLTSDSQSYRMNLNELWDSPTNRPFAALSINVLRDPDTRDDPNTRHRVFYGPGTVFPLDRQLKLADITDGMSNTILVVESGQKVTWTQFNEIKFDPANPPDPATMGRPNVSTFAVGMADGSVRTFRKTMNPQVLKALITPNGGEVVNLDD